MTLVDLGGGGVEPVTVNEAKLWCRIERGDEDALIGELIAAARETVERQTGLVLRRRRFRLVTDTVAPDRLIRVPCRPVVGIASVAAYGSDGNPVTFAAGEAAFGEASYGTAIRVSSAIAGAATNGLEIEFEAGFTAADVPRPLTLAIRQIVAASFEVRAVVAIEQQPGLVPASARALITSYREVRV